MRTVAKSPYFHVSKQKKTNRYFGHVNRLLYFTASNISAFQLQGLGKST